MAHVYVALLEEGTQVWRPVEARHVDGTTYELSGVVPDDETWEFQPGQCVECAPRALSSEEQLVATKLVPRISS